MCLAVCPCTSGAVVVGVKGQGFKGRNTFKVPSVADCGWTGSKSAKVGFGAGQVG